MIYLEEFRGNVFSLKTTLKGEKQKFVEMMKKLYTFSSSSCSNTFGKYHVPYKQIKCLQ